MRLPDLARLEGWAVRDMTGKMGIASSSLLIRMLYYNIMFLHSAFVRTWYSLITSSILA